MVISSKSYPKSIYDDLASNDDDDVFIYMDPSMASSELWLNCLKQKARMFCNSFRLDMSLNAYLRNIHFQNKNSLLNEYDQIIKIKLNTTKNDLSRSSPNCLK